MGRDTLGEAILWKVSLSSIWWENKIVGNMISILKNASSAGLKCCYEALHSKSQRFIYHTLGYIKGKR